MASSELLSWESLVRAGRLSRALDKEDPVNAPALRKLRISGLLPAAEPYTLRIWMPCSCGGCVVPLKIKAGCPRTTCVLVWNEDTKRCKLDLSGLAPTAADAPAPAAAAAVPGGTQPPPTCNATEEGAAPSLAAFAAQHSVGGREVYLGTFDTEVEAAVAYARAVGEPTAVVAEAEGLRLHLSSNSTGYKGVFKHHDGRRFRLQRFVGGKAIGCGTFDTAVEAAMRW
ncbi:hypothetical protein EMIHUDRAFT_204925 [Emiliania huxleyi CCMP1516]|uniref:AP2/ERF domain-containing protein n=2 Tax=Emiliania huxleyi TaxID=2903 RepID=A0A0D3JWK9_EMIH1|nr:hypothetical protein EMIHUDRAFT_204925 [Emiliania huxleyi CCMP1516]EOD27894.1 hypothetical protein EMIHUDRAFT_204925 [Emiliania huxleyi CCMP1516]|eukprot:XP_005780323.1 hypothetical protein EMIHUDRAFT_204925 [Emiliania huxleyi CCMP1516]